MLQITKIFRFEMAHAIHNYTGRCKNIHGHSYELHVTVASVDHDKNHIAGTGFIMDFKELKQLVNATVINKFDHKLLLSGEYIQSNPSLANQDNLCVWEAEPTAENLLIYIRQNIQQGLPPDIQLVKLKLYETNDSYAEWISDKR